MKTCEGCNHAIWKRTKAGRLHPSGDGACGFPWKMRPLPRAFDYVRGQPALFGGLINRKEEYEDHCPYYKLEA